MLGIGTSRKPTRVYSDGTATSSRETVDAPGLSWHQQNQPGRGPRTRCCPPVHRSTAAANGCASCTQPALELGDLGLQRLDPLGLLHKQPDLLLDQGDKLLARQLLRSRHST